MKKITKLKIVKIMAYPRLKHNNNKYQKNYNKKKKPKIN